MGETKAKTHPNEQDVHPLEHRVRFITAASLFDGHDASINVMRRILHSSGAEVIHLGHNRPVREVVQAAVQEDAQAIALSSYQGGHVEFFKYTIDLLKEAGAPHIKVFGGGGGTITKSEAQEMERYGVSKIYAPEDGRQLGLQGIINHMLQNASVSPLKHIDWKKLPDFATNQLALAQALTCIELGEEIASFPESKGHEKDLEGLSKLIDSKPDKSFVVGMTGTGGAGKSSLTDELVLRILSQDKDARIAVLAIDPTRRKTGGALLGDRLRMNSLRSSRCFMRSFATREAHVSVSKATHRAVQLLKAAGFDWIFVETGGIGQADSSIVGLVDVNVYVMTSEFGAPTQLEKINMLDYAHLVVINKFDKAGSDDALTEVRRHFRRNHREHEQTDPTLYPVFGTMASRFGDEGVNRTAQHLMKIKGSAERLQILDKPFVVNESGRLAVVPRNRSQYLAEIAAKVRDYRAKSERDVQAIADLESFERILRTGGISEAAVKEIRGIVENKRKALDPEVERSLAEYEERRKSYLGETLTYKVRDKDVHVPLTTLSLSQNHIRKVSPPHFVSKADTLKFLRAENLPGYFPFTAGVFPFKRTQEDPKRQFAGEGTPQRTNNRFHLLCRGEKAKRLSTAFDSVTLYGQDPDERPDIYGKIGESGVSVCTLEDAKVLYSGFDLCDPATSVSMTINGPAPMLLAFFFNTAIDQQVDFFREREKREPSAEEFATIRRET
jgi:methylmalonyl-CoA mutase